MTNRTTSLLAALLLAALPSTVHAQITGGGLPPGPVIPIACPPPTAARCANATFMTGTYAPGSCYAEQRQTCADALAAKWPSQFTGGTAVPEFLPDTDATPRPPVGANLLPGRASAYSTSALQLYASADSVFLVDPLATRLIRQQPIPGFLRDLFRPGLLFAGDGTAVTSCREYTYKRFWDYTEYQADVAACEGDGACIFNATYTGTHAIASRLLKQRNGATPLDSQIELRVGTYPKNLAAGVAVTDLWDYTNAGFGPGIPSYVPADPVKAAKVLLLKSRLGALPRYVLHDGTAPVPITPVTGLPTNTPPGNPNDPNGNPNDPGNNAPPEEHFFDEWAWHQKMHTRTSALSGAQFQEFRRRRTLLEDRIHELELANVWAASSPGTTGPTKAVHRARAALTDALLGELDLGVDGCLDASSYGCDWSYGDFTERFTRLYSAPMAAANFDCTELLGTKVFSASTVPVNASGPGVLPGEPLPRTDVGPFKKWLDARKAFYKQQFTKLPTYPGTGLGSGVVGSALASNNAFGDRSTFSAGYSYNMAWKVRKIASRADGTACAFAGEIRAEANADAYIFGKNVATVADAAHIVDSRTVLAMDPRKDGGSAHFTSRTTVLDYDLYTPKDEVAPSFAIVAPEQDLASPHARLTVVIAVVPVTIEGWAEIKFGAEGTFAANATNTCAGTARPNFGVNAEMRPHAAADALATVAVGVPGFQFGVKGRVALVHVDVPIRGGINFAEVEGKPVLRFDTHGDLKLDELSGDLSAFAEAAFLTWEKQIFAWDGFHQNFNMWNAESNIDLTAYQLVADAP